MDVAVRRRLVFRILAACLEQGLHACISGRKVDSRRLSGLKASLSRLDGGGQRPQLLFPADDGKGSPLQPFARRL